MYQKKSAFGHDGISSLVPNLLSRPQSTHLLSLRLLFEKGSLSLTFWSVDSAP
ncbi:hypothetical protein CSPX01_09743 [Colletotrichum filicis]|nr:hypothetical protein CSPX01_09743 [Colletotrichum filicis]